MLMTMMASQQCAQGAQNAQAGQQNNDNAKKLTEPAKVPEVKVAEVPKQEPKSQDTKEANLFDQIQKAGPSDTVAQNPTEDDELIDPSPSKTPDFSLPETGKKSGNQTLDPGRFDLPNGKSVSIPKAVEEPAAGVKVKEENAEPTNGSGGTFASLTAGLSKGLDESKKGEGEGAKQDALLNRSLAEAAFFPGTDFDVSSAAGGTGGGGSDSSFESLMAQYMGQGSGATTPGLGTSDVIFLPTSSDPKKPGLNIFQFASYRYRKAAYQDGLIDTARTSKRPLSAAITLMRSSSNASE
jgi:hypothetical protein